MVQALLLDSLIVVIVLLLGLMGLWRGPVREFLASAGILAAAQLASLWGLRIGDSIVNRIDIQATTAAFLAALTILVVVSIALGYGASLLLIDRDIALRSRIAGFAMGIGNGLLLVGFGLQFYQRLLLANQQSALLDRARVAGFLADQFRFVVLLYVLLGLAVVVFARMAASQLQSDQARLPMPSTLPPMPEGRREPKERSRPVATPRAADSGKVEPTPESRPMTAASDTDLSANYRVTRESSSLVGGGARPPEAPWAEAQSDSVENDDSMFSLWSLGLTEPHPERDADGNDLDREVDRSHGVDESRTDDRSVEVKRDLVPAAKSEAIEPADSPTEVAQPVEDRTSRHCVECGSEIVAGDRFCPNCGKSAPLGGE